MISNPIISQQIDGEKVEAETNFIFWGSKIIEDGDCSHKIKTNVLERKPMRNLDKVLKSKGTTLPTKVHIVKNCIFSFSYLFSKFPAFSVCPLLN